MRRAAKWLGWILAVAIGLPLVLLVCLLVAANTGAGRRAIEHLTPQLTGDTVRLSGISGRFPDALRVAHAELRDPQGTYTTVDDLVLDWSPLRLLRWQILVDRLAAGRIEVMRMPASSSSSSGFSIPAPVSVKELSVGRVDIAAAVVGTAAAIALDGAAEMSAPDTFQATLQVRRLDGEGSYALAAASDPTELHATLTASEPAHGLISGIAGLPDLGAVSVEAHLDGPKNAVTTHLALGAGPLHAAGDGTLDLLHQAADMTVSASAPAMRPRPEVAWQGITLDAHVRGPFDRPDATGHLRIDALDAAGGRAASINADIVSDAGRLRLKGEVAGLRLPVPNADLLAREPLTIEADARLDEPDRPVHVAIRHPLFAADADARLGATRSVDATLRVANLAPFAALDKVDLQGDLTTTLHATTQGDTTTATVDGTVGVTGGQQQARALVGEAGRFNVAVTLHGSDLTLSQLQFTGQGAAISASGSIASNRVDLSWSLTVNDLSAAAPDLAGQLRAQGTASGTTDNLDLIADINGGVTTRGVNSGPLIAHVEARGLPNNPSGRITAQGDLLDAPVDLAVSLQRSPEGLAIDIERASWKSLQAGGKLTLPTATMVPGGNVHITIERLADLSPLAGQKLAGRLDAALDATPERAHLTVEAQNAALEGTAAASRLTLVADVDQPQSHPALDAKLDAEGIRASGVVGSLHATAAGPADAIGVKLSASLPDLRGSPAQLNMAAKVDAVSRSVGVASLQGDWHQQSVRLLAPVQVTFADGVSVDRLRLGIRQAVLEVSGRAGQSLDLTVSLHNLPVDIAAVVSPAYAADGTIQAEARITGSSARPVGRVRLSATGLRARTGPGRALPPTNVTAQAELKGTEAQIDARLSAGRSRLNLTGRAPLAPAGAVDLRSSGMLDLALLDPITTASGRRVRGQLILDAVITGTVAAPSLGGTVRLAGGEVQDYTAGLHLTDMTASLQGNGASIRIVQFAAKAGKGTISGSGVIGVLEPGLPMDLTLTARNAEPLASDTITAVIDADLTLRGEALGQLAVAGRVHVQRADIRVPERLPSSVAVLPVREPGQKASPPPATVSVISLNIALDAPGQVFVRGRGLDVEFGGSMQITGTASAPQTQGALNLRRGTLNVAGHTLNFTEGQITFNGGSLSDPAIHLVATSTSANVVATLTIDGTAHSPKIKLSSVPPLPDDEVLAHLLFGTEIGRLGALEVAEIAAGLAMLTGTGGGFGDPLDKVRQSLGLDRLSVTTGARGSPALEAGRYIAPRVYLGAKQSASGGSQAVVQVDITKGLKLEATAGTGASSTTAPAGTSEGTSIGLKYQFEY